MKKVLLRDIIIPAGTVFTAAPTQTTLVSDEFYDCHTSLSKNTSGCFTYGIDETDFPGELDKWFTDLKE